MKIRYPGRFDIIPLGVDTETFRPRDKRDARKILSLPINGIIILYFARFSAHEKMDILPILRCFKSLLEQCPDISSNLFLLLAGEDTRYKYAQEVEKFAKDLQITDRIIFRTNPSFIEQPLIYSASDIFISFPDNFQESFGITVLEAMASGLPVVASDWDGYKDTIIHGETGFSVPTLWADCEDRISMYSPVCNWRLEHLFLAQSVCVDMTKMMEYISLLVKHPELRDKLGYSARKNVVEKYDWKVVIGQYEDLWRELYKQSQLSKKSSEERILLRPNRITTFGNYPSKILEGKTELHITPYGEEVLKKNEPLKYYKGMKKILLFPVIQDILIMTSSRISIESIEKELIDRYQKYSLLPQDVRYQVMWLLKHGMIEVMSDK